MAMLEVQGFVKRCPFCQVSFMTFPSGGTVVHHICLQVPIERDEGCAQMMCKNCRHVFCWFCLASLDVSHFFLFFLLF